MENQQIQSGQYNQKNIKWLTYLMFMMFAMTTDAVGVIIPEVMKEFNLSMTAAGFIALRTYDCHCFGGDFLGFFSR